MRVALSGTPGTGKSSVANILKKQGYAIVGLHSYATEHQCIVGIDRKRHSQIIDITKLNTSIKKNFTSETLVFFEGHISHLLPSMEKVIILRCHPKILTERLKKKKWAVKKIKENVVAETIDVILCEAAQQHLLKNIFEIDTTKKSIREVAAIIIAIVKKKFQPAKPYTIGQIDWSEEIVNESNP